MDSGINVVSDIWNEVVAVSSVEPPLNIKPILMKWLRWKILATEIHGGL